MFFEMTIQFRVSNFNEAREWYQTLLNKDADFVPHEGFAEWEVIPGCWLQIAEGESAMGSGPLRLGVTNLEETRGRLIHHLQVEPFEIHERAEVPVRWATFSDPWGNRLGLFEYLDKAEQADRVETIIGIKGHF
ncbi:VOC family protein [Radiobacillus sp. PE A8.2]|uniref:VOC family protein n=1 Tax=Radiobacillus sp. PE A8.2 TaxID=3380349 RepID=UPI003890ACFC